MGEHSRQVLAERAGVERDVVDRLVDLGILLSDGDDRDSTGDVRRARVV